MKLYNDQLMFFQKTFKTSHEILYLGSYIFQLEQQPTSKHLVQKCINKIFIIMNR
jgi:hypothetical protein